MKIIESNNILRLVNVALVIMMASAAYSQTTCDICPGQMVTLDAACSGGSGTITYAWSTGDNTQTISVTAAGTYTSTCTDANGCEIIHTFTVGSSSAIMASCAGNDPSCAGDSDGDATVTPSGGTGPYTYSWDNGGNTATITGLSAGTYSVTVTDANGCTGDCSVTLTDPPALIDNPTCTVN